MKQHRSVKAGPGRRPAPRATSVVAAPVEGRARGRPRSSAAHDAILAASIALIREVGYDAVTMDGIAERAGVGKATVYRRWKGKETLVAEAVGRIVERMTEPDTGSVEGDLLVLLRGDAQLYADPASRLLLSGLVAAMARSAPIARAVRDGFVATRRAAMHRVLERGAARGELRKPLDIELALDLLNGVPFYRYLITDGPIDERLARAVVKAVVRAFAPGAP